MGEKLRKWLFIAVMVMAMVFAGGLLIGNIIIVRHATGAYGELGDWRFGDILGLIGAIVLILILCYILKRKWFSKTPSKTLLGAVLIYAAVMALVNAAIYAPVLQADSLDLQNIIDGSGTLVYLKNCPQQLGYLLVMKLVSMVALDDLLGYIMVNIAFLLLTIVALDKITGLLFKSEEVEKNLLIIICGFMPLMQLATFVYNDMVGMGLGLTAVWMGLEIRREKLTARQRGWRVAWLMLALAGAIIIRQNTLIIAIAILIYLLATIDKKNLATTGVAIMGTVAMAMGGTLAVEAIYTVRTGENFLQNTEAFPATSYLAMGMGIEDEWSGRPVPRRDYNPAGWYNEYPTNCVYYLGTDDCAKESVVKIKERIGEFAENPGMAVQFYGSKITSQWNDPTFQMPLYTIDYERVAGSEVHKRLIEVNFEWDDVVHKTILLLVAVAMFVMWRRKEANWEKMLPMIAVMGYFLFSLLWEAKGRYILLVSPLLLPYAAMALKWVATTISVRKYHWKTKAECSSH